MSKFYFTFGVGDPVNAGGYVEIEGDWDSSREIMLKHFGRKWSMQYDEKLFAGQIEKYGLHKVELKED